MAVSQRLIAPMDGWNLPVRNIAEYQLLGGAMEEEGCCFFPRALLMWLAWLSSMIQDGPSWISSSRALSPLLCGPAKPTYIFMNER